MSNCFFGRLARKWRLMLAVGLAIGLSAAGCAPRAAGERPGMAGTISYGVLAPPSVSYEVGLAHADVLKKHAGMDVRVSPIASPDSQLELMRKKQLDVAEIDAYTASLAFQGEGIFAKDGPQDIRVLMTGNDIQFGALARADRGIRSIADLKGKKVHAIWPESSLVEVYSTAVLKAYGLTFADITALKYSNHDELADSIISGRADAYFSNVGIRPMVEKIDRAVGAYIIPIAHDPKVLGTVRQSLPVARPIALKSGYPGAQVDTPIHRHTDKPLRPRRYRRRPGLPHREDSAGAP